MFDMIPMFIAAVFAVIVVVFVVMGVLVLTGKAKLRPGSGDSHDSSDSSSFGD